MKFGENQQMYNFKNISGKFQINFKLVSRQLLQLNSTILYIKGSSKFMKNTLT